MEVTSLASLDPYGSYTYRDYLSWRFAERVEIILGKIFPMSPAPQTQHQHCLMSLASRFFNHFHGTCHVFPAPFDVILTHDGDYDKAQTIIQPDITVVCEGSKLKQRGCFGAPDLVVEIISPSTVKRDLHEKMSLYEEFGVREYWIVHPRDRTLVIHSPGQDGRYVPSRMMTSGDIVRSRIFPELEIEAGIVFTDIVEEPEGWYGENVVRIG